MFPKQVLREYSRVICLKSDSGPDVTPLKVEKSNNPRSARLEDGIKSPSIEVFRDRDNDFARNREPGNRFAATRLIFIHKNQTAKNA